MSNISTFTPERALFVEENIDTLGAAETAKRLGIAFQTLYRHLTKTGRKVKPPLRQYRVPVEPFATVTQPEAAYVLGLLWADGHLSKKGNEISIECIKDDIETVEWVFDILGDWSKYTRTRKGRTRPVRSLVTSGKPLHRFLAEHDYHDKSVKSPCKILERISSRLRSHFWRGYLDGDGSIYNRDKWQQIVFAGSYAQDWTALSRLLSEMDIPYRVKRVRSKSGTSSIVRVTQRDGCQRLLRYLYDGYEIDGIGLPRKHAKAIDVLAKTFERYHSPFRRTIKTPQELS